MGKKLKELKTQYNDFVNPNVTIKVGGKDITKEKNIIIQDVSVSLSTGLEASVCTFSFTSMVTNYNSKKEIEEAGCISEVTKLGAKVEVEMGYEKELKSVFVGYVYTANVNIESLSNINYTVEAMDVKAIMMNSRRMDVKTTNSYSAAVTELLKDYSSYYSKTKVDQTGELTTPIVQYNQSDYEFVAGLAKKLNYLFYVVNDEVNFIKYPTGDADIEIEPSVDMLNFSREVTLSDQVNTVIVRSNDEKDAEKPIEGKASTLKNKVGDGEQSASDAKIIDDKKVVVIIDNTVNSQEEAEKRAQAELERLSMGFAKGSFELSGIPEIEPGTYVKVEGFNKDLNGKYFVTEVRHEVNGSGYSTHCKFEVNTI